MPLKLRVQMKISAGHIIPFCLLANFLVSCTDHNVTKVERAFYYWKNNESYLTDGEVERLVNLNAQKLYVKFFEVETDPVFGSKPFAKSSLRIQEYSGYTQTAHDSLVCKTMQALNIIPTVYIKNEVFYNAPTGSLDTLADNIFFLVNKYYIEKIRNRWNDNMQNKTAAYKEIQVDCDWTEKTKDNYFYLLRALKKLSQRDISCTLRLYPYKYSNKMGIPPVDKATLMCYNLINPLENEDKNSIQNNEELEKYLRNIKDYPLHLDIALPVFSWMQLYQNNQLRGMINPEASDSQLLLKPVKPLWYELEKDAELGEHYLRQGDKIKLEEVSEKVTRESIGLLQRYLSMDSTTTVTLFQLDERNLQKYSDETLIGFYSAFSQ